MFFFKMQFSLQTSTPTQYKISQCWRQSARSGKITEWCDASSCNCSDPTVRLTSLDHIMKSRIVWTLKTFRPLVVKWDRLQVNKTTKKELNIWSCFTWGNVCYAGYTQLKSATHFGRPNLLFTALCRHYIPMVFIQIFTTLYHRGCTCSSTTNWETDLSHQNMDWTKTIKQTLMLSPVGSGA
jgi:hypothetical protein